MKRRAQRPPPERPSKNPGYGLSDHAGAASRRGGVEFVSASETLLEVRAQPGAADAQLVGQLGRGHGIISSSPESGQNAGMKSHFQMLSRGSRFEAGIKAFTVQ